MRVGVFGGSFDPITKGHIKLCNYLIDKKIVDEVWLLPCYISHYDKKMEECYERSYMCKLAVASNKNTKIRVCDYEIYHELKGESVDIMEKFIKDHKDHKLHFIIGMDNALKIHTWTNWQTLTTMLPFIVVPRGGYTEPLDIKNAWFNKKPHQYLSKYEPDVTSSTQVKVDFKKLGKKSDLVDKTVNSYIVTKNLYSNI